MTFATEIVATVIEHLGYLELDRAIGAHELAKMEKRRRRPKAACCGKRGTLVGKGERRPRCRNERSRCKKKISDEELEKAVAVRVGAIKQMEHAEEKEESAKKEFDAAVAHCRENTRVAKECSGS